MDDGGSYDGGRIAGGHVNLREDLIDGRSRRDKRHFFLHGHDEREIGRERDGRGVILYVSILFSYLFCTSTQNMMVTHEYPAFIVTNHKN